MIEIQSQIAKDMEPRTRVFMMSRLEQGGVEIWTDTTFLGQNSNGSIDIRHQRLGERTLAPVDAIVLCTGYRSRSGLYSALAGEGIPVRAIGDCVHVGRIQDAVRAGVEAGLSI